MLWPFLQCQGPGALAIRVTLHEQTPACSVLLRRGAQEELMGSNVAQPRTELQEHPSPPQALPSWLLLPRASVLLMTMRTPALPGSVSDASD